MGLLDDIFSFGNGGIVDNGAGGGTGTQVIEGITGEVRPTVELCGIVEPMEFSTGIVEPTDVVADIESSVDQEAEFFTLDVIGEVDDE